MMLPLEGLTVIAVEQAVAAPRWLKAGVYLAALALLATYGLRSALIARDYHALGIGYNSTAWRDSETVEMLRKLPDHTPVISNEVTAIMYLLDRPAYTLQEIYQQAPSQTFEAYGAGEDESQRVFREGGGALVLFFGTLREDFAMYGEQVDERLQALTRGLYVYYAGEDGAILFTQPPSPEDCY